MKEIIHSTLNILNKQERRKLTLLIIANTLISIVDIGALALLVYIIGYYTQQGFHNDLPFLTSLFSSTGSLYLIVAFLIFFIIKSVLGYFITNAQYRYVYGVAARISSWKMLQYLEGSYDDYIKTDLSIHVRQISQHPIEFCQYILAGLQQIFTELILCLLAITAILIYNPKLFLLISLLLLPPLILMAYFSKTRLKSARTHIKTSAEKTLQHLHEALAGYIESNINHKNEVFTSHYAVYQKRLNNHLSDLQSVQGVTFRLVEVFAILAFSILIIVNKWMGNTGPIQIINIGAFMVAAYKIIPSIIKISNLSGQVKTYKFTLSGLNQQQKAVNPTTYDKHKISSVTFKNVSFSLQDKSIIRNFNMAILPGDIIGISGISGKGKTTLVNLLLGFLDTESGEIMINNKPADAAKRKTYWSDIAYVKQQQFLVYDTILNNIILYDKQHNQENLSIAISCTGLDHFINSLPDKLNAIITENGKNISGGQRQRIALARAFYKNADLLILDEPFNELDNASEIAILNYLKELSQKGKMIILITHNTKSLSYCNKIFTIE